MADPVSSVASALEAALHALGGDLARRRSRLTWVARGRPSGVAATLR